MFKRIPSFLSDSLTFSLVKLAACLKPPSRANYRTIMTYWKDVTTPQPTTCNLSHRKN